MSHSVLLVAGREAVRDVVRAILGGTSELIITGEVDNDLDAVGAVSKVHPDLVLIDELLPGIDGIESTAAILQRFPSARVIILSMREDENTVLAAFRAGVRAYVSKRSSPVELPAALRAVLRVGLYFEFSNFRSSVEPNPAGRLGIRYRRNAQPQAIPVSVRDSGSAVWWLE